MWGLLDIIINREPREPSGQELIDIRNARVVELEDLGDGSDGVLGGLDVLHRSAVAVVNDLYEIWYGRGARLGVLSAAVHGHETNTVARRLTHLGRLVHHRLDESLQEVLLVLYRVRAAELQHVVPYAQRPLAVRVWPFRTLSFNQSLLLVFNNIYRESRVNLPINVRNGVRVVRTVA